MRGISMELLRRILSVMGFDCMRGTTSTRRSASRQTLSQVDGRNSHSQSCTSSLDPEQPHCQSCISYNVYFKQLSCGHMFCDSCMDHIVNLAFLDIEGLSEYPCPMCKSIRQLGLQIPESGQSAYSKEDSRNTSTVTLQQGSIEGMDEPET